MKIVKTWIDHNPKAALQGTWRGWVEWKHDGRWFQNSYTRYVQGSTQEEAEAKLREMVEHIKADKWTTVWEKADHD